MVVISCFLARASESRAKSVLCSDLAREIGPTYRVRGAGIEKKERERWHGGGGPQGEDENLSAPLLGGGNFFSFSLSLFFFFLFRNHGGRVFKRTNQSRTANNTRSTAFLPPHLLDQLRVNFNGGKRFLSILERLALLSRVSFILRGKFVTILAYLSSIIVVVAKIAFDRREEGWYVAAARRFDRRGAARGTRRKRRWYRNHR